MKRFSLSTMVLAACLATASGVVVGEAIAATPERPELRPLCGFPTVDTRLLGDVEGILHIYAEVDEVETLAFKVSAPIVFHNIQKDNGKGKVSDPQIREQVRVLNKAYKKTGIQFHLAGVNDVVKKKWFKNCDMYSQSGRLKGNYKSMTKALALDPRQYVNVYICDMPFGAAGVSTPAYPIPGLWPGLSEKNRRHGVMIDYQTLPFGGERFYNKGDNLVHELGHYFGLWHTFHPWPMSDGCDPLGDEVDDTPAESSPAFLALPPLGCGKGRDTCPDQPGLDPVNNFMDYSGDKCRKKFTKGQRQRIKATVRAYRPSLMGGTQ